MGEVEKEKVLSQSLKRHQEQDREAHLKELEDLKSGYESQAQLLHQRIQEMDSYI